MPEEKITLDPSIFDDGVWPGETEVSDEDLESRGTIGIKVPKEGVNSYTKEFKQSAGRDPISATVHTWSEVGYVVGMGGKPSGSEKYAEFNPVNVWVRVQLSGADAHLNTNPGYTLDNVFINLYPGIMRLTDEEISKRVEAAESGTPDKGLKGRLFSHLRGMRLLAQLCEATGHTDRLTAGLSGNKALRKLSSISDLMQDNGMGFTEIPIKVVIRKGKPDYYGETPDHEVIAFEAYDE